ncbi:HNH/ENDO VII family nuclease [Pseudomonas sp. BCRC 81390]|uniref:HNH/ENDO VII family nuclease n=1 Tax=Pseudomonas sp. BCRC 81390 TaxID=3054778 RepID=UPI0025948D35|nr:HNH/ENDO VII family nuclease [Pseudomonas sp. BCRC 81390]MDM3888414.1 HNH/ENDO VII family nuclease [Pseudomonas sp. BCRC 81390]
MSEEEKQTISALATLASGLAGAATGGGLADAVAAGQAGRNAAENNALSDIAEALAAGKTPEVVAEEHVKAENERYRQQNCAGLSSDACSVKMYKERREHLKDTLSTGADFVPVIGDIKSYAEAESALDYLAATIGIFPGVGDAAGKAIKAAETALKRRDLAEASRLINETSQYVASGAKGAGSATEAASVFTQQRIFWSKDPIQFGGNKVYQRNDLFDPNLQTSWREGGKVITGTNAERMASGRASIGVDGKSVNLHHMTQTQSGSIAEMTQSFHQSNGATIHINPNTIPSGIDRAAFDKWKVQYWKQRSADFRN